MFQRAALMRRLFVRMLQVETRAGVIMAKVQQQGVVLRSSKGM